MRLSVYSSSADSAPAPPPMEPEVTVTITGGSGMLRERGWPKGKKFMDFSCFLFRPIHSFFTMVLSHFL